MNRRKQGRKKKNRKKKGDVKPGGVNCHNSEGAGVLVTVVMVTMGQTQEAAGGVTMSQEQNRLAKWGR